MTRRELERPRRRGHGSLDKWLSKREGVVIDGPKKGRSSLLAPREVMHDCPVAAVRFVVRRGKIYFEPHTPEQLALAAIAGSAPCTCEARRQATINWRCGELPAKKGVGPKPSWASLSSCTAPYVDPDWVYLPDLSREERKERWAASVRSRMPRLVWLMLRDKYWVTERWHRTVSRPGFAGMLCDPCRGEGVLEAHPLYDHSRYQGYTYVRLLLVAKRSSTTIALVGIPKGQAYGARCFKEIPVDPLAIAHAVMTFTPREEISEAIAENRQKPALCVW